MHTCVDTGSYLDFFTCFITWCFQQNCNSQDNTNQEDQAYVDPGIANRIAVLSISRLAVFFNTNLWYLENVCAYFLYPD